MVGVGDRLYVIGGVGEEPRVTLEYTPESDSWTRRAPMPAEREHLAAAALDGRIYVIGGRWGSRGNLRTVEEYDPASDSWRIRTPLPTARGGLTAATVEGHIHVVGGEAFDPSRTFPEHEVYDPEADRWESAPPLPTARHGLASAGLDGRFYVIAGGRTAGLSVSDLTEIYAQE
jgi:N-acetylneuraminic acid mutarotase